MKLLICLVALASFAAAVESKQDMSGKMLTFPEATNTAHVRLNPEIQSFSAATVCHRSFTDLTRDHSLFSMATPSTFNEFLIFYDFAKKELAPHIRDVRASYGNLDYAPNQWHSICTTWDSSSALVQVWFNGQPLTKKFLSSQSPITGTPIIILGQEQDSYGGGFDINQSFVGMVTDVHMWDHVLSTCEIYKYMEGKRFSPGNALNWAALDFQITGRVLIEEKQDQCDKGDSRERH